MWRTTILTLIYKSIHSAVLNARWDKTCRCQTPTLSRSLRRRRLNLPSPSDRLSFGTSVRPKIVITCSLWEADAKADS